MPVLVPAIVFDSRRALPCRTTSSTAALVLDAAFEMRGASARLPPPSRAGRQWRGRRGGLSSPTLFSSPGMSHRRWRCSRRFRRARRRRRLVRRDVHRVQHGRALPGGPGAAWRPGALGRATRQPIIYAVAAGVIVSLREFSLPGPVANASRLLAGGAVALDAAPPRAPAGAAHRAGRGVRGGARHGYPPGGRAADRRGVGRLVGLEGMAFAVAVIQASTPTSTSPAPASALDRPMRARRWSQRRWSTPPSSAS